MTKGYFSMGSNLCERTSRKLNPRIKILQKQPCILRCGSHFSMTKCDPPPPGHLSMGALFFVTPALMHGH